VFTVQNRTCLIGGKCYGANEANPANEREKCDPEKSSTEWTPSKSDFLIGTNLLVCVKACGHHVGCMDVDAFSESLVTFYLHHPHKGYYNLPENQLTESIKI